MALINCQDCGREVSDRAPACPHCGGPIEAVEQTGAPTSISVEGEEFTGTKPLLVRLAARAIQSLNYRVDAADEVAGLVSFTTGITWGSWSGVSGSMIFEQTGEHRFKARGTAKQNVSGGQFIALDLFGEAGSKVRKIVDEMRRLANRPPEA